MDFFSFRCILILYPLRYMTPVYPKFTPHSKPELTSYMSNFLHNTAVILLTVLVTSGLSFAGDFESCGQPDSGDCFESNGTPGCNDEACCTDVCNFDNFCCTDGWDVTCTGYALTLCDSDIECGDKNSGDCYIPNGSPACDDSICCSTVCNADSYCCETLWDAVCADTAAAACFDGPIPENDECSGAFDLGDGDSITPFDTLGATTGGPELPAECESLSSSIITNDVWYSWTASTDELVVISTCNDANFDTRLAAYSGSCDSLEFMGCNDDGLGCEAYTSKLLLPVSAGTTYYIQLGGLTIGSAGQGNLSICEGNTCIASCIAECSEDSTSEAEFCGQLLNDGCNDEAGGYPVEPLEIGETICGSFWAFGGNRDTDWYQFTTTEISKLNLEIQANIGVSIFFLSDECPSPTFQIGETFDSCPAVLETCLPAGTWRILIAPNAFDGAPCGSQELNLYQCTLTAMPFDTPGNSCDAPIELDSLVGEFDFATTCTTTSGSPLPLECNSQGSQQIYNDIFFSWTAPSNGDYVFSTCNQADFDTRLAIYDSCSKE